MLNVERCVLIRVTGLRIGYSSTNEAVCVADTLPGLIKFQVHQFTSGDRQIDHRHPSYGFLGFMQFLFRAQINCQIKAAKRKVAADLYRPLKQYASGGFASFIAPAEGKNPTAKIEKLGDESLRPPLKLV